MTSLSGPTVTSLSGVYTWVSRVAILWNPGHVDPEFRETQRASRALDVQLQSLEVRASSDFDGAFQAAVRERAEALIVIGSRVMFLNRIARAAHLNGRIKWSWCPRVDKPIARNHVIQIRRRDRPRIAFWNPSFF